MRGVCLFLLALAAPGAVAFAAGGADIIHDVTTGTAHRDLYGLDFSDDGASGVAVGDRGSLVWSSDGGKSWQRQDMATDMALFDVALSGKRELVVGQMGLVRYRDGEGEWQNADSGTEERLLGVDLNADGLAVAVGTFGTMLRSTDGGATWTPVDFNLADHIEDGYQPHVNDVHVSADGTVTAVGEFALIVRSTDGGQTWSIVHQDEVSLFGLEIRDDGVGFAVGQEGLVLRTDDAGETWRALDTGIYANLLGVASTADGTVVVPGMRHMVISRDGGQTWQQLENGDVDRNWYIDAVASGAGTFAVGHTGRVIRIDKEKSD